MNSLRGSLSRVSSAAAIGRFAASSTYKSDLGKGLGYYNRTCVVEMAEFVLLNRAKTRYINTGANDVGKSTSGTNHSPTLDAMLCEMRRSNRINEELLQLKKDEKAEKAKALSEINKTLQLIHKELKKTKTSEEAAAEEGEEVIQAEAEESQKVLQAAAEESQKVLQAAAEDSEKVLSLVEDTSQTMRGRLVRSIGIAHLLAEQIGSLSEHLPDDESFILLKKILKIADNPNIQDIVSSTIGYLEGRVAREHLKTNIKVLFTREKLCGMAAFVAAAVWPLLAVMALNYLSH